MSKFDELVKLVRSKGWVASEIERKKKYLFAAFLSENKKMCFMVQGDMFCAAFYGFVPDNPLGIAFVDFGNFIRTEPNLTFDQMKSLI